MFEKKVLSHLAKKHRTVFENLALIEKQLDSRFFGLKHAVRALILSVSAGEPLLFIGPPGTGKSKLIRSFCELVGLDVEGRVVDEEKEEAGSDRQLERTSEPNQAANNGGGEDYFEYLITPFTEPGELFGQYDLAKAIDNKLERLTGGMMQNCKVVYLDEIFNGSSAILNSLLSFLQERRFHDGGKIYRVKMKCLFSSTNNRPKTNELLAVYDRFVLRCPVGNAPARPREIEELVRLGWPETFSSKNGGNPEAHTDQKLKEMLKKEYDSAADTKKALAGVLDEVESLRNEIAILTAVGALRPVENDPAYAQLASMIRQAGPYLLNARFSNRRIVKLVNIMLHHRLYEAVAGGEAPDEIRPVGKRELALFCRYFLDIYDEVEDWHDIEKICEGIACDSYAG